MCMFGEATNGSDHSTECAEVRNSICNERGCEPIPISVDDILCPMKIYFAYLPTSRPVSSRFMETGPHNSLNNKSEREKILYFYYYCRGIGWLYVHIWETRNTLRNGIVAFHATIKVNFTTNELEYEKEKQI